MFKLLSSAILVFFTIFCNAQGSWNIGYIKVDSLDKSHIGLTVRIDFKSANPLESGDGERHIRSYVGTKDTGKLTIDNTLFLLVEHRKIFVDHGGYADQYLKCITCKQESFFVYDAVILDLDDQTIFFKLNIEIERTDKILRKETRRVRIERNNLDGLMYKL